MTLEERVAALEQDKADRQEVNEQVHYVLTETAKFWTATQEDIQRLEGKVGSIPVGGRIVR